MADIRSSMDLYTERRSSPAVNRTWRRWDAEILISSGVAPSRISPIESANPPKALLKVLSVSSLNHISPYYLTEIGVSTRLLVALL